MTSTTASPTCSTKAAPGALSPSQSSAAGMPAVSPAVFRDPVIDPEKVGGHDNGRHQEHPVEAEGGGDCAAEQGPERIAEKHRRRGHAVDGAALGARDKPSDHRIGGGQQSTDKQAD